MKIVFRRFLVLLVFTLQFSCAQEIKEEPKVQEFPFTAENWTVENEDETAGEINTLDFKGKSSIKLEANQKAYLQHKKFENFVLEYYCNALSGPGLGFRIVDKENFDYLYLRIGLSGKKDAMQYVPTHNGNLPWQLYNYPKYEGNALFPKEKVATLPFDLKDELAVGKASDKLKNFLSEKGYSFSEKSEIAFADETMRYIFDPEEMKGLLFEEVDEEIVFLDPRTWIHIKVEVFGDSASFYIEDMETPALIVEKLKRNAAAGGISLISDGGGVYFADVSITELQEKEEAKKKTSEEKLSDNYLTKWQVSKMFMKDSINFVSQIDSVFQDKSTFKSIEADDDGLVDISRFYDDMTKTVVLTCNLESEVDKTVKLNFDYADHLVMLLNSEILFDKGMNFAPPEGKGEEGRIFVEDESVNLNLKKGKNELVIMLSADNRQKFNWGFISKLDSMEGVSVK